MNNNSSANIIYCSRCGAEMKSDSRYCMKCGNLNSEHEANKNMSQYVNKQESTYQIGSGVAVNVERKAGDIVSINKTGSKLLCYIFNLSLFIIAVLADIVVAYSYVGEFNNDMFAFWGFFACGISLFFLILLSLQILFMKANKPWWYALIPGLNYFSYFHIACEKWLPGLYIIIISILITVLMGINKFTALAALVLSVLLFLYILKIQGSFAKKFSHSSVLYILFPFVMLPVMAFDATTYKGIIYTDKRLTAEKDYKLKRLILFCFLVFFFGGLGITLYFKRSDFTRYRENLKKEYYVYAANQIYYEARSRFSNSQLSCDKIVFSPEYGTYYLYYPDVGRKIFLWFYKNRESIEASVKIVVENGEARYYISLTDGVYGFDETLYDDINIDTVTYKRDLGFIPISYNNYCEINYDKTKEA